MEYAHLKAFTYEGTGGNSAGVVLIDYRISDVEMQEKAAEIGFSETAYIKKINGDKFSFRFYTPTCEVDLCGHATIASFYYLALKEIIKPSEEKWNGIQTTKAGNFNVEVTYKDKKPNIVCMQQGQPEYFGEVKDLKGIGDSLNIQSYFLKLDSYNIYPSIISTGLRDLLIPVRSREVLNSIKPDFDKVRNLSLINQVVGYHLFTVENDNVYTRNFAPAVGIEEECATGTANGALIYLLSKEGIMNESIIIQGEAMGEKSIIYAKTVNFMNKYIIKIGGSAELIKEVE